MIEHESASVATDTDITPTPHVIIAETKFFAVKVPNLPHIPRDDGGHIFVEVKSGKENRWELTQGEAIECAWRTQLAGEVYWDAMRQMGIPR